MEEDERKIYYKTTNQIVLPPKSSWRIWKMALPTGEWKYFRGIKDIPTLRDLLVKFNPEAFYYSTSQFLNVENLEKPSYVVADNLFLFNKKLVIDIDNKDGSEQVRRDASEVLNIMGRYTESYLYKSCVFTGRGCRLEFDDLTEYPDDLMPSEKEQLVKERRKEFMSLNFSEIPGVDQIISWDTRRIIKCIGSPNPHNGHTAHKLISPAYIPAIPGPFLVNEVMRRNTDRSRPLREQGRATDQESGNSPSYPLFFGKFIRNKVEGTKDRFVPFFVYKKQWKHWQENLVFLQKNYGLSSIYVLDDDLKVYCMSIDAIPAARLDKIYKQSKSLTKTQWRKFRDLYIRTSAYFNQDLKRIKEYDLKPLFKIDNDNAKLHPLSKPHLDFVNEMGFNTSSVNPEDKLIIGNTRNKIFETYFQDRRLDHQ